MSKNKKSKLIIYSIFLCLLAVSMTPSIETVPVTGYFSVQSGFTPYTTLTFGGKLEVQAENLKTIFLNPVPTNGSTDVAITTNDWNITIEDPEGDTFNWTIETSPNVGSGSANGASNGSKNITLAGLAYSTTYTVYANATESGDWETNRSICTFATEDEAVFTSYATLTFGGKLNATEAPNESVVFSNPYPANNSVNVLITQATWNITIEDPEGGPFNWSIESSAGSNSSNGAFNGSKVVIISGNLSYSTTYTFYVNATDGHNNTNETFNFQTGNLLNVTINGSTNVEETDVILYGQLINNGSYNTTCWFQLKAESLDFTTPDVNVSAGLVANGSGFSAYVGNLSNGTFYYFRTRANNTYGWNHSWNTSYILTKPQPATTLTATLIGGGYNMSWTHGDGYNASALVVNENHYPQTTGDGDNIYFGPNDYHIHTGLTPGQTYYYRIWEYANWSNPIEAKYSDDNESIKIMYVGDQPVLSNPNPANESINIDITTTTWNITIESPKVQHFNWTIESSIGSNSSDDDTNGSKFINITGNLSYGQTYTVWVNATETTNANWTNETFWFTTQTNNAPTITYPNPANTSTGVEITIDYWNITIEDPEGDPFNWTIESSLGSNSSTGDSNGSKNITITGNLSYYIKYYVYVNVTDSNNNVANETFWFTTKEATLILYATLTFGGKCSVQGDTPLITDHQPANESMGIEMYPLLNVTVDEPQDQNFNISWSTNATDTWVYYNSTCTDGTFRQRATFANSSNTTYWWTVHVNNTDNRWANETYHFTTDNYSWGNWSSWWTFNYTCCGPTSLQASTYSESAINLTWTLCDDGCDSNVLVVNESGWSSYPITPTNGTEIYNGTNASYNHTGLVRETTYYYTIWGYNATSNNYSILNDTASAATQGDIVVSLPYPPNLSTENTRPPTNISIQANGTSIDVYIYWLNMTPYPDVWEELISWTSVDTNRFNVVNLNVNWTTQFIWGNTTYHWMVNVTDGVTWVNNSYQYNTTQLASGANARYDVSNDNWVDGTDILYDYAHRTGSATYDGIYDVSNDGWIDGTDILQIYANRS